MHTQAQARMGYAFQITSIYTYIYLLFATANGKKAQKTNAKHARSHSPLFFLFSQCQRRRLFWYFLRYALHVYNLHTFIYI